MKVKAGVMLAGLGIAGFAMRSKSHQEIPAPEPQITLLAVGDIMMHADVKTTASQKGFASLWSDPALEWKAADLTFANLETPVAPTTGRPGRPYQFNGPPELPAALKAAGLQVLSAANNHAFDQGSKGVVETLQRLRAEGLVPIGTGATKAEAEQTVYVERNGVKLALLGFTDIFNNDLDGSPSKPWVRKLDLDSACAAVAEARKDADAVIVSIHWGIEDHHDPTPRQEEGVARLVAAGADLILGHHPHVLQPMAWVYAGGRVGLAAYSLGNFISNQDRVYRSQDKVESGDERDGLMVRVVLQKRSGGVNFVSAEGIPLWCENNWRSRGQGRVIQTVRIASALAQPGSDRGLLETRAARIRAIVGPLVKPIPQGEDGIGSHPDPIPAVSHP